ncbi:hypothetical protein SAMN06893096_101253 [Geodermatophilus pulveris]|uniref:Uncharacterized protein n=1 Tax=Geodermatophilus pulveris TaxID=1564159 RepID=A0A239AVB2_9ACTN|nr:hypothetical protein [Geodermatophilus pulveris]SNR99520.1 hypothetical protein SAMN06893096_101253 [Geodermatophilus pulveris]
MTARDGSARVRPARPTARPARPAARRTGPRRPSGPAPVTPVDGLVLGDPPLLGRVVGVLLVLAGVTGALGLFPTYLVVGGTALSPSADAAGLLAGLLAPVAAVAVGGGLAAGRVPRFGLAFAGIGGGPALGLLLIELYRASTSTVRPGIEVIAGQRVLTSAVDVRAGWVLGAVALALTVLAGVLAVAAWGRTVMDDAGALDPARPALAGAAALLGVLAVLCLVLPAADLPDRIVTDPTTGLQVVVEQEGPQGLFERPGLALLGGLLLAGAVVLGSVLAPSLRPRLATVGGLLAIAVVVLSAGLAGLRDAVVSGDLEWTLPGAGLLLAGLGHVALTVLAWRLRRAPVRDPSAAGG